MFHLSNKITLDRLLAFINIYIQKLPDRSAWSKSIKVTPTCASTLSIGTNVAWQICFIRVSRLPPPVHLLYQWAPMLPDRSALSKNTKVTPTCASTLSMGTNVAWQICFIKEYQGYLHLCILLYQLAPMLPDRSALSKSMKVTPTYASTLSMGTNVAWQICFIKEYQSYPHMRIYFINGHQCCLTDLLYQRVSKLPPPAHLLYQWAPMLPDRSALSKSIKVTPTCASTLSMGTNVAWQICFIKEYQGYLHLCIYFINGHQCCLTDLYQRVSRLPPTCASTLSMGTNVAWQICFINWYQSWLTHLLIINGYQIA